MKSRKRLSHQMLLSEAMGQLRWEQNAVWNNSSRRCAISNSEYYNAYANANLLFAQCFRFPCAAPDIKRRIETLIEREYLERDREDNGVYNYLA